MIFKLTRMDDEEISFSPTVPPFMSRFTIPDPRGLYGSGGFGSILLYEMEGPGFNIRYGHYIMKQAAELSAHINSPALDLHFALHNRLRYQLEGLGEVRLPEGHYNITYAPYIRNIVKFEAARHYTLLDIHFTRGYLDKLAPYFPLLEEFLQRTESSAAGMLSPQHIGISTELQGVIYNMLHCEFNGDLKTIYLQSKVQELLLMSLYRMGGGKPLQEDIRLWPQDYEKIREARDYLLFNMDQPCTVIELAHKVGLNDFKLKKGFKQLYGSTIFDFLLEARIEKARMLLTETGLSIQEIASATGYKNISSFTAAFKKKTGVSPRSFKQKNNGPGQDSEDW